MTQKSIIPQIADKLSLRELYPNTLCGDVSNPDNTSTINPCIMTQCVSVSRSNTVNVAIETMTKTAMIMSILLLLNRAFIDHVAVDGDHEMVDITMSLQTYSSMQTAYLYTIGNTLAAHQQYESEDLKLSVIGDEVIGAKLY